MKGSNVINLNHATMIEALEDYFAKIMPNLKPAVESVDTSGTTYDKSFKVVLVERPPEGKSDG